MSNTAVQDPERIARIKWIMATTQDERREALVWLADTAPDVFAAVQRHVTIKRATLIRTN
jgi:hypothetical protein